MKKRSIVPQIILNLFFIIATITFIIPFILMVSISFSNEKDILDYGFKVIPMHFSTTAYSTLFAEPDSMLWSALFTIIVSVIQAFLTNIICALIAYPLARPDWRHKKFINRLLIFTMLFDGGMVAHYILNTQYLHLKNTFWIHIIPAVSAWVIILYRTFFKGIPEEMYESAKLDGATETQILRSIVVPMSIPIFAMQVFVSFISGWNNWGTSLYYITDSKLWTIQYYMQIMLQYTTELEKLYRENPQFAGATLPVETLRYAMAVLATIPVICIFPFVQKYFEKGVNVGSIKG